MEPYQNIVVAVDFSSRSRSALLQAVRLAKWQDSDLHLIHIVESQALADLGVKAGTPTDKAMHSDSADEMRVKLENMAAEAEVLPDRTHYAIRTGSRFDEIIDYMDDVDCDLLVLGSKSDAAESAEASAMTTRFIRKAKAKVLIVRHAHTQPFTHINCFIDFSRHSAKVLRQAIRIARVDGAALEICHVYLPPWKVVHYMSSSANLSEKDKEKHREKIRKKLENVLKPYEEESRGIDVSYELVETSERIVGIDRFIEESNADLVIMGTRSRKGIRMVLARTIAEHIIRTSPCSVLAIKIDSLFRGSA
jgi:nucleotide-binding universal stress UspA family protein